MEDIEKLKSDNKKYKDLLRMVIREKYQLSSREQAFIERLNNEGRPLPPDVQKRATDYLGVVTQAGEEVWKL